MSIESAIASRNSLLTTLGKNVLNIKYPKEFELYVIALELTDDYFNTKKYFIFPVNPSSLEELKPQITNVKKTLAGITVLKTPTFVPTDITLTGSFGRGFKVLLGTDYQDLVHSFQTQNGFDDTTGNNRYSTNSNSIGKGLVEVFNDRIKTGYGCLKLLEEIVDDSKKLFADGGRKLILHNPALGNSYLVTAGTLRQSMTEQTNMIWNYSLPLKSIAPLESIYSQQQMESIGVRLNISNFMQDKVNSLLNNASRLLEKGYNETQKILK